MEDREILALFERRDEAALAWTARKYGSYCRTIAARCLPRREDQEECLNDVWVRAWETIPPQRPRELRLYLGAIARNLSFSRWRTIYAEKRGGAAVELALDELDECLPAPGTPEEAVESRALSEAVNRFLAGLGRRDRGIFLRRYYYNETAPEIAARYQMKQGHVQVILSRTRGKLRVFLSKEGYA